MVLYAGNWIGSNSIQFDRPIDTPEDHNMTQD